MLGSNRFFISKELSTSQIDWDGVVELLEKNSPDESSSVLQRRVSEFRKKLTSTLRFEWFLKGALSEGDNQVAATLAQLNGADSLIVTHSKTILSFPLLIEYRHVIALSPRFAKLAGAQSSVMGSVRLEAELHIGKFVFKINSLPRIMALQLLVIFTGVLLYVVAVYLFLYSMSVFIVFLQEPQALTVAALRQGKLGIALLAFCIFLAVIVGKISRMAARRIFKRPPR